MDAELKKAKLEGRTALARLVNNRQAPWNTLFTGVAPRLINVAKSDTKGCEVHMATRRTTLNPREVMVLRVLLPKPFDQYPPKVGLRISLSFGPGARDYNLELFPDTEENR